MPKDLTVLPEHRVRLAIRATLPRATRLVHRHPRFPTNAEATRDPIANGRRLDLVHGAP
jgi:hypothetical protein